MKPRRGTVEIETLRRYGRAPAGTRARGSVVLSHSEGMPLPYSIEFRIRNGDDQQILDGVTDTDKVVTTGAYGLPDKTKVKIEAAEAPAEGSDSAKPTAEGD